MSEHPLVKSFANGFVVTGILTIVTSAAVYAEDILVWNYKKFRRNYEDR